MITAEFLFRLALALMALPIMVGLLWLAWAAFIIVESFFDKGGSVMHRSFRYLVIRLSKIDRDHLRNVEDKRTGKALFLRFYKHFPTRGFAPTGCAGNESVQQAQNNASPVVPSSSAAVVR